MGAEPELEERNGGRRPVRVGVVSPEPTPFRAPLFDRLSERPELDLTVIYNARTLAARGWETKIHHRAVFLAGPSLPLGRFLHYDYPVTPAVWRILGEQRFECLMIAGWSMFASQAALLWCRLHRVPYILTAESHLDEPRARWKLALRRLVLPHVIEPAAAHLAPGSKSSQHFRAYGASAESIFRFAVTMDVEQYAERVEVRRPSRLEARSRLDLAPEDIGLLFVGRLIDVKGADVLLRGAASLAAEGLPVRVVVVGDGPERPTLESLAAQLGIAATFCGVLSGDRLLDAYVAADVFVLPSYRETWGLVVNEAAAAGLPLVLSDRVGAAPDLVRESENGRVFAAGRPEALADAIRWFAVDPQRRRTAGELSRRIVKAWGYEDSIRGFVEAVGRAVNRDLAG